MVGFERRGEREAPRPCGLSERAPPAPWHRRWGKADRRGNPYPAKQRPERKIDSAVALMMAVGRAMAGDEGQGCLDDFLRDPPFA
jgi:hypothetical protein